MSNMSTWLNTIGNGVYGRDVRAAIHDSIDEITSGQSVYTAIKRTIENGFPGVDIDYIYEVVTGYSTLEGTPSYFAISKSRFDPAKDGLVIWRTRESTEWRPMIINGNNYYFLEDAANNNINVTFFQASTFQLGDEAEFFIFKPKYVHSDDVKSIVRITDTAYNNLLNPDPNTLYCVISSGDMESS